MKKVTANRRRSRRAAGALVDSKEDRISKLPDPILHDILCFLDQRTAATTSVLSKSWRYLWCTRPQIDFRYGSTVLAGKNKESFLSVLDRTLQGYLDLKLHLQELTLHLSHSDSNETVSFVNKWIRILVQGMSVNKFHLEFLPIYNSKFIKIKLPIFQTESLHDLFLKSCTLRKSVTAAHLKHLRKLTLDDVVIQEKVLDLILSKCRLLDYVSLSRCSGFKRIQLKHPANLNEFSFSGYYNNVKGVVTIAMGDGHIPTLRTLNIHYCFLLVNSDHQFYFSHLTHLTMTYVKVSLFSCDLPCLEELRLFNCPDMKEFNLSSPSMKRMEISHYHSPIKVTVNAPSIVSFRYKGVFPQSISFSAAASSWKSYIDLTCFFTERICLNNLIGLLKALSQSEISIELLERTVRRLRDQLPNTNVGADLPVVVDHLIVAEPMPAFRSPSAEPFLNNLFLVLRPRFIYMNYIKALAKSPRVTEINLKQRDMVQQLFPKGVSTQVLYWNTDKWIPFEPKILSKFISINGESMDETCGQTDLERRIKLVIFDLDRASICYRKFIRNYLALCY